VFDFTSSIIEFEARRTLKLLLYQYTWHSDCHGIPDLKLSLHL
jgi:hypothetical protein